MPVTIVDDAEAEERGYNRGYCEGLMKRRQSLSLLQIDWLRGVIEVARSRVDCLFDEHGAEAALDRLRAELTKEET